MIKKLLLYSILLLLVSCKPNNDKVNKNTNFENVDLTYAKGFKIEKSDNITLLTVIDPWQGANAIEYKYALINKDSDYQQIDKSWILVKTPVERVVCLSTTHIAFIDALQKTNTIVGVSGTDYVNNKELRNKVEQKKLADVGYDNSLNYELIASLNPDLVITYGIGSQVASYNQKLNELGITTIINAEYLENNPLGKLEWIKFMAAFYNAEDIAETYFENVVQEYESLLNLTNNIEEKPKVLFGLPWKDTWYVPGGNSYLARMVKDAGGTYLWENNESRESLPFDVESIFSLASSADIWLNTGTVNSKQEIIKSDIRFESFIPYHKSKIYNNNKRMNKYGGNDYWESGLTNPHIVLKDMIKILHPHLLPEYKLVYYKPIH